LEDELIGLSLNGMGDIKKYFNRVDLKKVRANMKKYKLHKKG
jgi:hypothetical protein